MADMKTPIYDFVKEYSAAGVSRFHMPGHKGKEFLGIEKYDITEIDGADVLYSPNGIIAKSEDCTSSLFKSAHSFYSAEGSSLAIKAMLAIVCRAKEKPLILAGRNAHKSFIYAAALLDFDVAWLGSPACHIAAVSISKDDVRRALRSQLTMPAAVYLTSPDYLGNMLDIEGIAKVCDSFGVPLLVDNAHGAYLAFLEESRHPIKLGAAMCADSAHKTLPVLTGGAYLHVSEKHKGFISGAREMLSLFASTSPSYPILASLDLCNAYLAGDFPQRLKSAVDTVERVKLKLASFGIEPLPSEPLKIVIHASQYGYSGSQLAALLARGSVFPEFYDRDYLVLMASPENKAVDYERIIDVFSKITPRAPFMEKMPPIPAPRPVISIREAIFSEAELVRSEEAEGRILAAPSVCCPPAVPIAVSGERLSKETVRLFTYYGIEYISVVVQ